MFFNTCILTSFSINSYSWCIFKYYGKLFNSFFEMYEKKKGSVFR